MKHKPAFLFTCVLFLSLAARPPETVAQDDREIDITHLGARRIPISLEGYTGEVLNVLTFDLEIQGFEVTGADKAQYVVSGSNNSDVTGIPNKSCTSIHRIHCPRMLAYSRLDVT